MHSYSQPLSPIRRCRKNRCRRCRLRSECSARCRWGRRVHTLGGAVGDEALGAALAAVVDAAKVDVLVDPAALLAEVAIVVFGAAVLPAGIGRVRPVRVPLAVVLAAVARIVVVVVKLGIAVPLADALDRAVQDARRLATLDHDVRSELLAAVIGASAARDGSAEVDRGTHAVRTALVRLAVAVVVDAVADLLSCVRLGAGIRGARAAAGDEARPAGAAGDHADVAARAVPRRAPA